MDPALKYIQLYRGKYVPTKSPLKQKVIALDLDETLGAFSDLAIMFKSTNQTQNFNELLDLFPEFLRTGILPILEYLLTKKKQGNCKHIYMYTNNQCQLTNQENHADWPTMISAYLSYKLKTDQPIFDKIICAFKINNRRIEPARTTQQKTHQDFIKCTLLPKSTEICFIDNDYHDKMTHNQVYYIQPKSYHHGLSKNEMMMRLNSVIKPLPLIIPLSNCIKTASEKEDDTKVAQKLMYYVREFFYLTAQRKQTKSLRLKMGKITRKRRP
jgi:hypothetical protein